MTRRLRLPVVGAVLALVAPLCAPSTAFAATPAPVPGGEAISPAQPPAPVPLPTVSTSPTASAAELNTQVARQQRLLAEQEVHLAAASAEATRALETYQAAKRQAEQAKIKADQEEARLVAARQATADAKQQLSHYIGSMYRTGMGNRRLALYSSLMDASTPQQLFSGLGLVQRVGTNQRDALVALAEAEAAQRAAAVRATEARKAQEAAQARAAQAKIAADAVVAQANVRVMDRKIALLRTQAAAAAALAQERRRAALLARAMLIARERMMAPNAAIDGALVPRPNAACKGKPTSGYENGRIPEDALCPLWGTRGQMLRADAAAAFNDMSKAYAQVFGAPICVTDSYRSYEEQVAVAEEKPHLAARPGTSNHGWGVATDLCDGIQNFGTATHKWMQDNSMIYGWFHPAWAQQGGSKPEAWHWEFAGRWPGVAMAWG